MPYLQHPEVGPEIGFARSDHTIAVPRPQFDADLGIVGACAQCHTDRSARDLENDARRLWGELRPHRPLVQGQIDELRARNPAEAAAFLLRPDQTDPLIQFQAMSRLLVGYLAPDSPEIAAGIRRGLLALTGNRDLDVRALALAALHWIEGDDPAVRAVLVEALESEAADEALRARWVLTLGFLGDRYREEGDFERSDAGYRKALELRPGDPDILGARALLRIRAGEFPEAVGLFRQSLEADPTQSLGWVNLGIALAGLGDTGGAAEAYRRALDLNPLDAVALFNLGNLLQRAGRLAEAEEAYQRAVEADMGLGRAHFELARVRNMQGRPSDALPHARRAVEFLPDHLPSRQMLQDLQRAMAG
jgi:tetratricopeptide (TPR) repeat protein